MENVGRDIVNIWGMVMDLSQHIVEMYMLNNGYYCHIHLHLSSDAYITSSVCTPYAPVYTD